MAHPTNLEPDAAAVVSVTDALAAKLAEHVSPQSIPAGELVIVPLPVPPLFTRILKGPAEVNVATTAVYPDKVKVHVLAVEHPPFPVHPTKVELVAGLETNTIDVPEENDARSGAPPAQLPR